MNDMLYQLALTQVPYIGLVQARILAQQFETAEAIFKASAAELERTEGIGPVRARAIKAYNNFTAAEKEMGFIEKNKIKTLFLTDTDYPQRLLHCYDPPTLLFYRGTANLNATRIVSVIGTRNHTEYGKHVTETLIKDLAGFNVLVISGLALGIDGLAHKAAIKHNLSTVGVLAHGLDTIYPSQHNSLSKDMLKHEGGLLTEFVSCTQPDKHNFPTRNRIVAGMSDAVVVVETGIKGGSMITAELANSYNRDVFAIPGKITDTKSYGCNYLIKNNKAILLTEANQLAETMGWTEQVIKPVKKEKELLIELTGTEKIIVSILTEKEKTHIDELTTKSGINSSATAVAILNLELQNIIQSLPGKLYKLL
ncbi:MAG: DNA-processing protein DprA [Chitinophagaceae bacterium]